MVIGDPRHLIYIKTLLHILLLLLLLLLLL